MGLGKKKKIKKGGKNTPTDLVESVSNQKLPKKDTLADLLRDSDNRFLQMLVPMKKASYLSEGNGRGSFQTIISFDPAHKTIIFSSLAGKDFTKVKSDAFTYKAELFGDSFFDTFNKLINEYSAKHTAAQNATTVVVLPDNVFEFDTVSLPTMQRMRMFDSLDIIAEDLHRKMEVSSSKAILQQNRQFTTFALGTVSRALLSSIYATCAGCKMTPKSVTFASAAVTNALSILNGKLQRATYIVLGISEKSAVFTFVNRGKTVGCYPLPFGYSILHSNKLASEDVLLDHSVAELTVLNAMEKARAKKLSVMQGDTTSLMGQALNEMGGEIVDGENAPATDAATDTAAEDEFKIMPKKQARKLPKFMQRPEPETPEQYVYENFRIFIKWTLNLLDQNKALFPSEKPAVYVDLPKEFEFVLKMTNEEADENGVRFSPMPLQNVKPEVRDNLAIYGGLIYNPANAANNF